MKWKPPGLAVKAFEEQSATVQNTLMCDLRSAPSIDFQPVIYQVHNVSHAHFLRIGSSHVARIFFWSLQI